MSAKRRRALAGALVGLGTLGATAPAFARGFEAVGGSDVNFGIAGGLNFSETNTNTVDPDFGFFTKMTLGGFSGTGAVSISLFQQSVIGIGLGADYVHYSLSNDTVTFTGNAVIASALININIHHWNRHHVLGIGYAYWDLMNYSAGNTTNIVENKKLSGLAFVGKDYLQAERTEGVFIASKVFYFNSSNDFSPFLTVSLLLGFDF